MSIARKIGNVADVIDSAASGDFFAKGSADGQFQEIAYSSLVGTPTAIDSALTSQLIDSSYIQLRQTSAAAGLDSATTINLIDSSYVAARSSSSGSSGFDIFNYTATNNQTTFQDSSNDGTVLSYTENGILVYYNGLLLADDDYTATSGSSVVLAVGADSGASIAIAKWSLAGSGGGSSGIAWGGDRGLFYNDAYNTKVIEYVDITTAGNAASFGTFSAVHGRSGSVSDTTYGVVAGGSGNIVDMSYSTIATTGNASDFGDLTSGRRDFHGGSSDGSRGLFWGGTSNSNVIDYITIASTGNATDFGDTTAGAYGTMATADATYGVCALGSTGSVTNVIDYVTIQTAANSTDFGDRTQGSFNGSACSDTTRGLFVGGGAPSRTNVIDYITIATTGNATDFGDLESEREYIAATSNSTRGLFGGGAANTGGTNILQFVVIQTTGNTTDFGDLSVSTSQNAAFSGSPS